MRIITFNLNGIRAAARKGFFAWAIAQQADVICVQELKASEEKLHDVALQLKGYLFYYRCAQKSGYSGVGIYTRCEPDRVSDNFAWDVARHEGRFLQADFGKLSIISLYLPSGSSGEARQAIKFECMEKLQVHLQNLLHDRGRQYIICGDWNIVHKEIDIKNFKANQKNSGCLPQERAWLDALFTKLHFIDAFREINQQAEQYTWWSQRGGARAKNVGWRIDYQLLTPGLKNTVKQVEIYTQHNFSDHAPLIVDYQF